MKIAGSALAFGGVVTCLTQDGGRLKVAKLGSDALFVLLHSYDLTKQHAEITLLEGKRVMVTITTDFGPDDKVPVTWAMNDDN